MIVILIAIINLILGVFYLLTPLLFLFFGGKENLYFIPYMKELLLAQTYNSFTYIAAGYLVVGAIMLMGIINLTFCLKILKHRDKVDKYLKYGIISAIIAFFLGGFYTANVTLPIIHVMSSRNY